MAIHVRVTHDDGKDTLELRGENAVIEGGVVRVYTEPHEVKPGGLVDPFVGKAYALMPGDLVEVVRV